MAERGCYIDVPALKRALSIADNRDDTRLFELAEAASRQVESETGRRFYVVAATRYFTAACSGRLIVPDLLTVTTLATDDGTRAYATTWTATDYDLEPANEWPKWEIKTTPNGSYSFPSYSRGVKIVGTWGYGDGDGSSPWTVTAATLTVATTDGTAVTTSTDQGLGVGQTWRAGSEDIYVTAGSGTSWTVERGVNGTTGAAHAAAAISVARYPKQIVEATRMRVELDKNVPISGASGSADTGQVVADGRAFARYRDIVESFKLWGVA